MDELDGHCWILEPEKPTRKDLYRKIAVSKYHIKSKIQRFLNIFWKSKIFWDSEGLFLVLYIYEYIHSFIQGIFNIAGSNVSLKIDVDPKNPRLFPSITWLGSESAVYASREKVADRIEVYFCVFEHFKNWSLVTFDLKIVHF